MTRDVIAEKIEALELELLAETECHSAEASIEHCDQQIRYWKLRQLLASFDANKPGRGSSAAFTRARQASEQSASWEQRKSVALKNQINAQLDAWAKRLEAQQTTAAALAGIETT